MARLRKRTICVVRTPEVFWDSFRCPSRQGAFSSLSHPRPQGTSPSGTPHRGLLGWLRGYISGYAYSGISALWWCVRRENCWLGEEKAQDANPMGWRSLRELESWGRADETTPEPCQARCRIPFLTAPLPLPPPPLFVCLFDFPGVSAAEDDGDDDATTGGPRRPDVPFRVAQSTKYPFRR